MGCQLIGAALACKLAKDTGQHYCTIRRHYFTMPKRYARIFAPAAPCTIETRAAGWRFRPGFTLIDDAALKISGEEIDQRKYHVDLPETLERAITTVQTRVRNLLNKPTYGSAFTRDSRDNDAKNDIALCVSFREGIMW